MVKFDPTLAVRSNFAPGAPPEGMRAGPCAMGPTAGDEPTSMHVWVFQQQEGGLAFASGDTRHQPVFTAQGERRWKVRTALDPDSRDFELNQPAVAVATALVSDNGRIDVKQWSQAVMIAETSPFPGRDPA